MRSLLIPLPRLRPLLANLFPYPPASAHDDTAAARQHIAFPDQRLQVARLAVNCLLAARTRSELLSSGQLRPMPPNSGAAAEALDMRSALKLSDGLEKMLNGWSDSSDSRKKRIYKLWSAAL